MEWYEQSFGEDYHLIYKHRSEEEAVNEINALENIVNLNKEYSILDLCCGNGRHSIELAKRGYNVTGFDLSVYLLNVAKRRAGDLAIEFIKGDMRNLPFIKEFDIVLNLFTSFGYFRDDNENFLVIKQVNKALKNDGIFIIDYMNKPHLLENLVPHSNRCLNGIEINERRWVDDDMVYKNVQVIKKGRTKVYQERVKLYTFDMMKGFINRAGLMIEGVFGSYDWSSFNSNSNRMIIVARNI